MAKILYHDDMRWVTSQSNAPEKEEQIGIAIYQEKYPPAITLYFVPD